MTVPRTGGKDNGERFEVHATDGRGKDVLVGYSNRAEGGDLVMLVDRHPVWHTPRVIDRVSGEIHTAPPSTKGIRPKEKA